MKICRESIILWPQQNKAQPIRVHISRDIVYVALAQTKWSIFCRHHFQAHFLFENRFILAENCFNSFPRNKSIFWTTEDLVYGKGINVNHYMMTSSNGNISALLALGWGIHRSTVNSPHKGQWRGALMFTLICAWTNGWVNNRETGDLRRHQAHYDVIVIEKKCQKMSSHPMRGIRPSVGQSETALLEILKSYWAHCHAMVCFSLFLYGICGFSLNQY